MLNKKFYMTKGFIASSDTNSIFNEKKDSKVAGSLFQNAKEKKKGYILEIIFHGLNYSAKRLKLYRKRFVVDVHKSEVFVCNEKINVPFKSRIYKRRLIFFSYDLKQINNIKNTIKMLKMPNSYTGKGLFSRLDNYNTKKVKKKK